nr:unnamed protein product [Callosobruchus analis]
MSIKYNGRVLCEYFLADKEVDFNCTDEQKFIEHSQIKMVKYLLPLTAKSGVKLSTLCQEHLSLPKVPESGYLEHLSLISGKATRVSKYITEFLKPTHIDCDKLITLGSDGTAVNTGSIGGVI